MGSADGRGAVRGLRRVGSAISGSLQGFRVASRRRGCGALACAALAGLASACSPLDLDSGAGARQEVPPVVLRGVALEGWNGPVRELSLTAERASIDLGARVASLDQVRIALSGPESRGLEVRAPRGEFDLQHGALWLRGGVEGQTQPGERFTTEALRFDQQAGRLRSDQPVRIERPNLDLSARGMDIDLGERRLLLRGAVQAELKAQ